MKMAVLAAARQEGEDSSEEESDESFEANASAKSAYLKLHDRITQSYEIQCPENDKHSVKTYHRAFSKHLNVLKDGAGDMM
jgi:hypothetical protein